MNENIEMIRSLIGQSKGQTLEYSAILLTSNRIAEIICAFANSDGGVLMLGLSESGMPLGLSTDFYPDQKITDAIGLLDTKPIFSCGSFEVAGKRVFYIKIEKSLDTILLNGKKYIRAGEEIVKANVDDLKVIVILTAIKIEYLAVRAQLSDISSLEEDSVNYEQGLFVYKGRAIARIIIRECGQKNSASSQEAQRGLTSFRPYAMFFVGIAGSRKPNDFGLGDVIFPEIVHYYEGGKSKFNSFEARPDDVRPTFHLFEIAKRERLLDNWKTLIKEKIDHEVKADIGIIASGEQIVEHFNSDIGEILSLHYGDTSCVAMEEYGFLNTLSRQGGKYSGVIAGVVRGISDILERRTDDEKKLNQETDRRPDSAKINAANTASAFTFWLILKMLETKNI